MCNWLCMEASSDGFLEWVGGWVGVGLVRFFHCSIIPNQKVSTSTSEMC